MCPSRPHATLCFIVFKPASRVRVRLDQFGLCQGSTRACVRDRIILCDYITNPLLLSIPQLLNLGGILRTIYDVVWPLRLWITFMIVSTITLLIDPVRMSKADAVLMMMCGSLSALVGAYYGFSVGAAKK